MVKSVWAPLRIDKTFNNRNKLLTLQLRESMDSKGTHLRMDKTIIMDRTVRMDKTIKTLLLIPK
jgi:hypothetical protein